MLRARSLLGCAFVSCSCADLYRILMGRLVQDPLHGAPCFPFIGEGKARVTVEEKEKNQREKKAFRIVGSFFSFMQAPPTM